MSIIDQAYSKMSPARDRSGSSQNQQQQQQRAVAASQQQQQHQNTISTGAFMRAMEAECERIKDTDPSLVGGYQIIYDREVPFEIRAAESPGDESAGAYEGLMVKILVQTAPTSSGNSTEHLVVGPGDISQNGSGVPSFISLRVELSSETDLFFHYTCAVNAQGYAMLREDQRLTCSFQEFAGSLIRMFNRCIAEPQALVAVILLGSDASATVQLIQNFDYKLVEVLALPFRESPQDLVRCHVEYRYRAIRSRLAIMTSKLHDVAALVKVRDTALLPVLQQEGQQQAAAE